MKKILLLFAAVFCMMAANAQQFTDASGIKYNVTSESTVEVVANDYSGDIVIPATVEYNDVMYRVTSISSFAFQTCRGLTSITLPSSVTSIGENAFASCSSLLSLTLSEGLTSIGEYAFWYCESLTSITIPSSVTTIGTCATGHCVNLSSIRVDEGSTVYDSRDNCNAIIEKATNTLVAGCKNTVVPSTVTAIGESAFYELTNLTSITIPNSVTSIGESAFSNCTSLSSVSLPSSLTSIGESAFSYCTSLPSVSLPSSLTSSLTSIGESAFTNCTSLSSVSLPSGLTSIGESAFSSCVSLSSIAVFAPNPPALGTNVFAGISPNATVRVPNGKTDDYRSAWGSYFNGFQFAELTTDDYRQQALCEINGAMQGVELTDEEQTAINTYIQAINDAEDVTAIENAKEAALAFIRLKPDKTEAIAAIEAAMQGETGAYLTGLVQQYVSIINAATDVTAINNARDTALTVLNAAVPIYKTIKAEAFGEMGTECEGCPAIRVTKGEKEIILYAPEKVEIIKIPANTNN